MKTKHHVLLITELYYPSVGGQEVRFQEIAEELVRRGNQVDVLTIDHVGDLPDQETQNGVSIKRPLHSEQYKKPAGGRKVTDILLFTFRVIQHLLKNRYDFILINQWPVLPALFVRFIIGRTPYRVDFVEYRESLSWRIINQTLSLINRENFICISDSVKDRLSNKDLTVIPSLVKTSEYSSSAKDRVVFLGRMEKHKNPELAIQSFLQCESRNEYSFHIIGDGALYESLKEKYIDQKSVFFHGFVSDDKKKALLEKAKLLVLPSEREGLPKTVIEAIASECPIVTTNQSQNHTHYFVSQYQVGEVCPPTIDEIASSIDKVLSNYDQYQKACRVVSVNHDLSTGVGKIEAMFHG